MASEQHSAQRADNGLMLEALLTLTPAQIVDGVTLHGELVLGFTHITAIIK